MGKLFGRIHCDVIWWWVFYWLALSNTSKIPSCDFEGLEINTTRYSAKINI